MTSLTNMVFGLYASQKIYEPDIWHSRCSYCFYNIYHWCLENLNVLAFNKNIKNVSFFYFWGGEWKLFLGKSETAILKLFLLYVFWCFQFAFWCKYRFWWFFRHESIFDEEMRDIGPLKSVKLKKSTKSTKIMCVELKSCPKWYAKFRVDTCNVTDSRIYILGRYRENEMFQSRGFMQIHSRGQRPSEWICLKARDWNMSSR